MEKLASLEMRYQEALKLIPHDCFLCNDPLQNIVCKRCKYSCLHDGNEDLFVPYFESRPGRQNEWKGE